MKKVFLFFAVLFTIGGYSQTTIQNSGNNINILGGPSTLSYAKQDIGIIYHSRGQLIFRTGIDVLYSVDYTDIDSPVTANIDDLVDTLIYYRSLSDAGKDWKQQLSEGTLDNYGSQFKFGQNTDVGAIEEVIWDAGGNYTFLSVAETMKVVSTNANDSLDGLGAQTILIQGLNANWDETQQLITLEGVDTVLTDTSFLRVFRVIVLTSGNPSPIGDSNLGILKILGSSTFTLQAQIGIGNGQTLMCVYTVPRGKTAYVTGISFGVGEGKECTFKGRFRNGVNGAFSVKYSQTLFQSTFFGTLQIPLRIPEMIDMVITGKSAASGVIADASFGLILKDN